MVREVLGFKFQVVPVYIIFEKPKAVFNGLAADARQFVEGHGTIF